MSFRGKIVERKKINSPIGPIEMVTTEYPNPKRSKVIWWLGEGKVVELGKLVTHYMAGPRKSEFEEIKWESFFYMVELNGEADAEEAIDSSGSRIEIEGEGKYSFDELEEAEEFIEEIKCKSVTYGMINVTNRPEMERWKEALRRAEEE